MKKAREAMARHIVQNRLTDPADLQGFTATRLTGPTARQCCSRGIVPKTDLRRGISNIRDNAAEITKADTC